MPQLSIGRIVQYRLSEEDADAINRRRVTGAGAGHSASWPNGAQAHVGNLAQVGDTVPAIVVTPWSDFSFNGQAFLDGNDVLWLTSVQWGTGPGHWHWPELRTPTAQEKSNG